MSKDCSSGTPAFIIVASWRVKIAMSLSLDLLAAAHAALLDLGDHDALAAQGRADHRLAAGAHLAAHRLAGLVLAFPVEDEFLDVSVRLLQSPWWPSPNPGVSLFVGAAEITSSSWSVPALTFIRPDWRSDRARRPCCACAAMSHGALPCARMMLLDRFGDRHDLVDADPALVAVAVAALRSRRPVGLPAAVQVVLGEAGLQHGLVADMSAGCLQVHRRRARRWAVIRMTEDAMLNGATPMFIRRVRVDGASLVCSVENTMWPVCAALIAMSAVSRSRISPTMMMSGSWRRNDFSATAKVRPALSLTLTWLTPGRLISAGSSTVEMLMPGLFRTFRQVYSDTVLPRAGRARSPAPCRRGAGSRPAGSSFSTGS